MADLVAEVVFATPGRQVCREICVPAGTTIGEAIAVSGIVEAFEGEISAAELLTMDVGVYGKLVSRKQTVEAGDRIEIYRPLVADPKELRRQRARKK